MDIYYNNLVDTASSVTASTEDAAYPVENVQNRLITRTWRTGVTQAAETITFDLGSATDIDSAILTAHDLTASDTSIQLRGSTDNFSASDVLIATFTHDAGSMLVSFSTASYRYYRIAFTKSSSAEARNIGRIYLGEVSSTTYDPIHTGFSLDRKDEVISTRTLGGQVYSDLRYSYNELGIQFDSIPQADKDVLYNAFVTNSTHEPLWIVIQSGAADSSIGDPHYVRFDEAPKFKVSGYDGGFLWDTGTFKFNEEI